MRLKKSFWILITVGVVFIIGSIFVFPKIQNYKYVRGIKKGSVNMFSASDGVHTVRFTTKEAFGALYPNAYFSIQWKNSANNTSGAQDMKSDSQGIATAVLPAGTVEAFWSPASKDFYLPYSVCPAGIPGISVCDTATSPTIDVMEDAPIGK